MYTVQTNKAIKYGHPDMPREEKSKFEFEEKKISIVLKMEVCGLKTQQISNFSTILNLSLKLLWFFQIKMLIKRSDNI